MKTKRTLFAAVATMGLTGLIAASPAAGADAPDRRHRPAHVRLLASGLQGTIGSTIGPDGALYVPEAALGQITRIDPRNGRTTTFASGLPPAAFGGAIDVAFIGTTAYVLVTLVEISGIYRIDDADSATVIADLGAFSVAHPPTAPAEIPIGVQFALEPIAGGFLISDGNHNRVLRVTLAGEITQLIAFGNVVPTGLEVSGNTVYMAEAGPVPHTPASGKVVRFDQRSPAVTDVASGFSVIVDVERGPHGVLYALSQGDSPGVVPAGSPATPDSGELLRVNADGTFSVVVEELDLPTSVDFVGDTAFVTTLNGEVWTVRHVSKAARRAGSSR